MTTGKKIALGSVIFVVIVLIGLAIVIPMLVDVDRYRPQVAAHIREETGKPAEIGHLSLTIFPALSIRVDDFALGNPEGFPRGNLLKVRRIVAQVDGGALWNRQVIIKSLELDDPAINLVSDLRGRWNFENPAQKHEVKKVSSTGPSSFTLGVISKVRIVGGQLAVANLTPLNESAPRSFFEANGVSSQLEQVNLNAFVASASASLSPGPDSPYLVHGAGHWASIAFAASTGMTPAAEGTLRADSLRFGEIRATGVKSRLRLFPKQVFFDDLNLDLYGGHAGGNLSFNFAGQNLRYATNTRLSGLDVAKLLSAFPDARGKMTGKMDGNVKLSGEVTHSTDPLAGMKGTGQVNVRNGQLPSLQLNKNLMLLARLTNLGPVSGDPSSFSSISADLNIANQRITSDKITVMGNGADVEGTGSLTLGGEGSLDYDGVAKVASGQNPLSGILANLSGATFADGKLTFPFNVGGTLQVPKFRLKSAGGGGRLGGLQSLAGDGSGLPGAQQQDQTQQQPADLVQGIAGLFKKKQTTQQQPSQPPKQ